MKFRFFHIPVAHPGEAATELNQFVSSHRVASVDRQFIADGTQSAWAFCVMYDDAPRATGNRGTADAGRPRVDYRALLPADEFEVFAELRGIRKELAARDGVPPYAVFTNEQLADIVRGRVTTLHALRAVDTVGASRVEKYGAQIVAAMQAAAPRLQGEGDEDAPT